jgi:hypothetical protein
MPKTVSILALLCLFAAAPAAAAARTHEAGTHAPQETADDELGRLLTQARRGKGDPERRVYTSAEVERKAKILDKPFPTSPKARPLRRRRGR